MGTFKEYPLIILMISILTEFCPWIIIENKQQYKLRY